MPMPDPHTLEELPDPIRRFRPDWRDKSRRAELFLDFYRFTCKYASHPGGVYYVLPYLAQHYRWGVEQRAWFAWINGNTQNPVTSLLLMEASDHRIDDYRDMLDFFERHAAVLSWDTDRRYHRKSFPEATHRYLDSVSRTGSQEGYFLAAIARGTAGDRSRWSALWAAANALPTMGRLSSWSYLEYLRILLPHLIPDSDTLMLEDLPGSRSHRNGLALVMGRDDLLWHREDTRNPNRIYTSSALRRMGRYGKDLLREAQRRAVGTEWAHTVTNLTLESALCTFKGMHRVNRRYPGVYNDMLYNRLTLAERRFGFRFQPIWESRRAALPEWMRLEDNPRDPGCVPVKQNWFLEHGEVVTMGRDPEFQSYRNEFDARLDMGEFVSLRVSK